MTALRKKRVWTIADFARHAYSDDSEAARAKALRWLKHLHAKHGGTLLRPSLVGANRKWTVHLATLMRLEPDLFAPIDCLEYRLEALEENIDATRDEQRSVVNQVRQNSRDVASLRRRR